MWLLLAILAVAGEPDPSAREPGSSVAGAHDAAAPESVSIEAAPVPDGPPVRVTAAPGDDLRATVAALPAGSTLVLAPGAHAGPLYVDRPLEIAGEPGAFLDGGGRGSVLVIAAPDVHVHDLRVTGSGNQRQQNDSGIVVGGDRFVLERVVVDHAYLGIDVRMAKDGRIDGCTIAGDPALAFGLRGDGIRLWEAYRTQVVDNTLTDVRDLVIWYSDENTLAGNTITGSRYGAHLMYASHNTIVDNTFDGNVVGVFVMYSENTIVRRNTVTGADGEAGVGFGFKESNTQVVVDNVLVGNTTGILLDTTPHRLGGSAVFSGNLIGACEIGVRMHGRSPGARFEGNTFDGNRLDGSIDGRFQEGRPTFEGNTWSAYQGYDLDGDGRGDLPFEARSVTTSLVQRRPDLAWFTGTPAAGLLELFANAFPMFAPDPILVDPRPTMGPVPRPTP